MTKTLKQKQESSTVRSKNKINKILRKFSIISIFSWSFLLGEQNEKSNAVSISLKAESIKHDLIIKQHGECPPPPVFHIGVICFNTVIISSQGLLKKKIILWENIDCSKIQKSPWKTRSTPANSSTFLLTEVFKGGIQGLLL